MIGNIGDGQSELVIRACIAENTFARLQNMKILHRNVKQCNDHVQSGGNPRFAIDFFLDRSSKFSDRKRFVEPETPTPVNPTANDLASGYKL